MWHNNIKFQKWRNVKSKSGEEKREKLMKWHWDIRYNVLPYCDGYVGSFHPYYGRFPPERQYNMDHIPMPFVVDQQNTFTLADDENVQVCRTGAEGLNKCQYTARVFIDAALTTEDTNIDCSSGG